MNLQERSDKRSLELHREVVKRLQKDPTLWGIPLSNIERWTGDKGELPSYYHAWKTILTTWPKEKILKLLVSRSQRATHLRSSSPFTGILDQETRNRIFEKWRIKMKPSESDSLGVKGIEGKTMTWNYRVIKQERPEGMTYAIYEVYYDEQDNIQFLSKDPVSPHGETITELTNDLKYMRQALKMPILDMDELDKSFAKDSLPDSPAP